MHELHISPYFTKSVKPYATRQLGLQTTRSGKLETRESAYFVRPVNSATEVSFGGRTWWICRKVCKCQNAKDYMITSPKNWHVHKKGPFFRQYFPFQQGTLYVSAVKLYTPFHRFTKIQNHDLCFDPVSSELYQTQHAAIVQFYIDPVVEPPLWRILSSKY